MTHSFRSHHFHLVWSTKNRSPFIVPDIQQALYARIGRSVQNHGGKMLAIGGISDHVHLLIGLSLPDKFSNIICQIKSNTSQWMNQQGTQTGFAWQEGYRSFSVSYSGLEAVKHYIVNQEMHHKNTNFDEEYLGLLKKHHLPFNE